MARPKVLVTGVFDILTEAHVRLLKWASIFGTVTVGIDDDRTVASLGKGPGRPILSAQERTDLLLLLPFVGQVVVFHGPGASGVIRKLKPHLWVKGGDYTIDRLREDELAAAAEVRCGICFAPKLKGPSTTEIINRARRFQGANPDGRS